MKTVYQYPRTETVLMQPCSIILKASAGPENPVSAPSQAKAPKMA